MTPLLLICAVPILAACLAWREHFAAADRRHTPSVESERKLLRHAKAVTENKSGGTGLARWMRSAIARVRSRSGIHLRANQPQARATSVNSATPAEDARYNRTVRSGARPAGDDFAGSGEAQTSKPEEGGEQQRQAAPLVAALIRRGDARPARDSILIRRQILLQLWPKVKGLK